MKKGDFVITTTNLIGDVNIYQFGEDKVWAESCYKMFKGDIVTLYVVGELFFDDIYLSPIKTRKRNEHE